MITIRNPQTQFKLLRSLHYLGFSTKNLKLERHHNKGALKIRIAFWGILYFKYDKNPQNSIGNF